MLMNVKQQGFGMIEILVALLVITIGLVGATGMNAVSLKNSVTSMNRSNAVFLAGSIADKIRSTGENDIYETLIEPSSQDCVTNECSVDELVTFYKSEWLCQLGVEDDDCSVTAILPVGGNGNIEMLDDGTYRIKIEYKDTIAFDSDGNRVSDPETITLTMVIQP